MSRSCSPATGCLNRRRPGRDLSPIHGSNHRISRRRIGSARRCQQSPRSFLGRLWAVTARPHAGIRGFQRSTDDDLQSDVSAGQRPVSDLDGPPRTQAADESACKPGSVPAPEAHGTAIPLGLPLPTASCGLPGSSGGPPSSAPCLTLLRVGFAEPPGSPRALVVSYTTVSPLPAAARERRSASLWHCPAGHPGWALPTTLPCGARTFLGETREVPDATVRPARPPYPAA